MRKGVLFFVKTVLVLALVFAVGCGKNDNDEGKNSGNNTENNSGNNSGNDTKYVVPAPEGTIMANLSENTGISILLNTNQYGDRRREGYIKWTKPDNFYLAVGWAYMNVSICDVGSISGLGNITKIPLSGFTTPIAIVDVGVACERGHGYVIKFEDHYEDVYGVNGDFYIINKEVYVRLYVVEKIISTSGGIMGAKVKYQYPFEP